MAAVTVYAIWYLNEAGLWVQYQTFDRPLDADRAFQAIQRMRPAWRMRLIRQIVTVLADAGEE